MGIACRFELGRWWFTRKNRRIRPCSSAPPNTVSAFMGSHIVRFGLSGHVGHFVAAEAARYPRHARVVLRSSRGLELGEVLSTPDASDPVADPMAEADGQILRRMTVEDNLLEARLEKHRHKAFTACSELLEQHNVDAVLMEVEHLFDGQGLYFYFLGDVPAEAEKLTGKLAETYEANVEFRQFSETLTEGCGPGCGTEAAMGQGGCASCTSCSVASACGVGKQPL